MKDFFTFIDKLETPDNKACLEAVREGVKAIFEGYMDVRPDPDDVSTIPAIDRFNGMAAKHCMSMGSPVLSQLHQWNLENRSKYTVDEEENLDNVFTNDFLGDYLKKFTPISKDGSLGVYGSPKGGF